MNSENIKIGDVIVFLKEHTVLIEAQPKRRGQMRRSEELQYIFRTNVGDDKYDPYEIREIVKCDCFEKLWKIPHTTNSDGSEDYAVKNLEIDLDGITNTYLIRFTTEEYIYGTEFALELAEIDDYCRPIFFPVEK